MPLSVTLSADDPTEATVPSVVEIPAGKDSAAFSISAVEDLVVDGSQVVTITAKAVAATWGGPIVSTGVFNHSGSTGALAVQPDGKVVTAGYLYLGSGNNFADMLVSRFNPDGSLDTSFGTNGKTQVDITGETDDPTAVVIQSDGKIVVAGTGYNGPQFDFILTRLNGDGAVDTTFGVNGRVNIDLGPFSYNEIWDLEIQPDGAILAGGNIDLDFAVVRYTESGQLDTTFGVGGKAIVAAGTLSSRGFGLLRQADGKIVVAGVANGGNSSSTLALARFTSEGKLYTTFGTSGVTNTNIAGGYEGLFSIAEQSSGKLVVTGHVAPGSATAGYNFVLARYSANGILDNAFGTNGYTVATAFGLVGYASSTVAIQPDDRIVVSAMGLFGGAARPLVARFGEDGALQNYTFSQSAGKYDPELFLQPNGTIWMTAATAFNGVSYLERFQSTEVHSATAKLTVTDNDAPANLVSVVINGGEQQRSRVTTLALRFDQPLQAGPLADAFEIRRLTDNAEPALIQVAAVSAGNETVVTLTFTGTNTESGGSLTDGRWRLTIDPGAVLNLGGTPMNPAMPYEFHRLFGDADGDRDVDTSDYAAFRAVFGGPSNAFDFDSDGEVDAADFAEFRVRFGMTI